MGCTCALLCNSQVSEMFEWLVLDWKYSKICLECVILLGYKREFMKTLAPLFVCTAIVEYDFLISEPCSAYA